jgi:ABC-type enterochelin transport system permease subunit
MTKLPKVAKVPADFSIDTSAIHQVVWSLKNGDTSVSRVKTEGEAILVGSVIKIVFYNLNSGVEYFITPEDFMAMQPEELDSVADSKGRITADSIAKAIK